jgi:metal-responsive CopG/Arc/MetJ family transcriptional regulator
MIENHTPGMIQLCQEAVIMADKITISLPSGMLTVLDELSQVWETTRSGVVAELIRMGKQQEIAKQLAIGYAEWALENQKESNLVFDAQSEVVLRD